MSRAAIGVLGLAIILLLAVLSLGWGREAEPYACPEPDCPVAP